MLTPDLVGYIAACLTTGAFIPQAWMTWRRKRADGVSLGMYLIMVAGIVMWLTYGIMLQAWPVIIANIITMLLAVFILAMKIIYK
jgi:MtN3 and saliva related transmembrane protein